MAITATSQTIFDGERIAIMKFYATMGATENETNVVKVNPSTLGASAAGGACNGVTILKVTALTHGLEVQMNAEQSVHARLHQNWWSNQQRWRRQNRRYLFHYPGWGRWRHLHRGVGNAEVLR